MSKCSRHKNYTNHHHQHNNHIHQHQQQQQQQKINLFLPIMLCSRTSVNDIKLSHLHLQSSNSSSPTTRISCTGGGNGNHHAKRNNKVVGLITAAATSVSNHKLNPAHSVKSRHNTSKSNTSSSSQVAESTVIKYRKIKQCFFSKSLTTSPTLSSDFVLADDGSSRSRSRRCQVAGMRVSNHTTSTNYSTCRSRSKCDVNSAAIGVVRDLRNQIHIASLDPPLPVVRRKTVPQSGSKDKESSLWKRRSGGTGPALRCLQVRSSIHSGGGGAGVVGSESVEANTV